MKPVPLDLISFARIPKRDRRGDGPQYRIYIRGVPGGLGAGYTDIIVCKIGRRGWYLFDRVRGGGVVNGPEIAPGLYQENYHPTRDAAAAEIHLAEEYIPANVREYLEEVGS